MVHGGTWRQDDAVLDRNWRLACRVATASGGLAAALAAALYLFAGVSAGFLVVVTAVVALVIGLRLPPASPKLALQRVRERLRRLTATHAGRARGHSGGRPIGLAPPGSARATMPG